MWVTSTFTARALALHVYSLSGGRNFTGDKWHLTAKEALHADAACRRLDVRFGEIHFHMEERPLLADSTRLMQNRDTPFRLTTRHSTGGRMLGARKRTLMNESGLCRRICSYPLGSVQKQAFQ